MIGSTGERITFIDDEGTVLTPFETFGVLVTWWMQTHPGIVLAPATTPQWIASLVAELGGSFAATPGEASAVLRASAAPNTCLAADGEGGFIWPYFFGAYDAMYTLIKLLEMRAVFETPLSEMRRMLPVSTYITATEFCPWEAKGKVMRRLLEDHEGRELDLVDGLKVFVDGGFVLVRPDPDEPSYHVVASVGDEATGQRLVDEYLDRVRAAQGTNGHAVPSALVADTAPTP
jgi:mannose-1-phosphate guanylyltransferase/phosphomannomutase